MVDLAEFFDGVQLVSALAIIAFVIFYFAFRKDIKDTMRKK